MANANPWISAMKGLSGIAVVFISILIAGLTAEPDLVPIYSGVLIAILNFAKHWLIQIGVMSA